jgi:hypothetical protein
MAFVFHIRHHWHLLDECLWLFRLTWAAMGTSDSAGTDRLVLVTSEQCDDLLLAFNSISDSLSAQFLAAREGSSVPSPEIRQDVYAGAHREP